MLQAVATPLANTFEEVRRAVGGSDGGFSALDRRFRPRLEILVGTWMGNPRRFRPELRRRVQPDDVVQDTLRRAYRDLTRFEHRGTDSFWRWICHIARHAMLDAIREATRERDDVRREVHARLSGEDARDPLAQEAGAAESPRRGAMDSEMRLAIGRAIAGLPPREALVVREHFLHGRTMAEIGELLGIKTTRVFQLKARALLQLKALLGGSTAFGRLLATG